ncbi:MAG: hypothetical protein C1943_11175 [Halochromatium sp.]|nr:hypothetical protein [Halochromatium sp.]
MPYRVLNPLRQRGFTLVEVMIALTIGLFLSGGILALFITSKQSYHVSEAMSEVQERGRFAIEFLARDLRQAGFREFDQATNVQTTLTEPIIIGWEGANVDPSTESLASYTAQTDVFRIRYRWFDSDTNAFTDRQVLYYIAPSSVPGLRRKIDTSNAQELMEGVYDMQISYGLDTDGDDQLDSYALASAVADWNQVVTVRVNLLLRSSENNQAEAPMALPFLLNDGTTTFIASTGDRGIYQMFSTTIALRNRLP